MPLVASRGQRQGVCAAAGRADGQSFAAEIGEEKHGDFRPAEDQQGLVGDAAEGPERQGVGPGGRGGVGPLQGLGSFRRFGRDGVAGCVGESALDKADIHDERGIAEAAEIIQGAVRGEVHQLHAAAREGQR